MNKILLAGAAVVFAGIAATMAMASDHKASKHPSEPMRATVITPAKTASVHHKGPAPKRHHPVKKHHAVHKAHAK